MTIQTTHEIKKHAESVIPTDLGDFIVMAYSADEHEAMPHLVIASKGYELNDVTTIRLHSECITGDIFGSKRCDCGEQLDKSLAIIAREKGILIYLRQEGRGIGIINKLRAYNLQDKGLNTVDANIHMGFEADEREYSMAIAILKDLDVKKINLLTNNPEKIDAFDNSGIELVNHIPLQIDPSKDNKEYLQTKEHLMGHLLNLKTD